MGFLMSENGDFADLSVVTDPHVRVVLKELLAEWRMRKRWDDFPSPARRLHQHILRSYLRTGRPPVRQVLEQLTVEDREDLLADLVDRDLLFLDGEKIAGAYPFSSNPTRHSVLIDAQPIAAVCAIDALGAGAMARRPARVTSHCPVCEMEIAVDIGNSGLRLQSVFPLSAVVWAGFAPIEQCAADTQCRTMLIFCSDTHLHDWRNRSPGANDGHRFTPEQALEAGAAIFRPFLPEP